MIPNKSPPPFDRARARAGEKSKYQRGSFIPASKMGTSKCSRMLLHQCVSYELYSVWYPFWGAQRRPPGPIWRGIETSKGGSLGGGGVFLIPVIPYHTIPCTVLYCTVLYCIVLYCTVLYCTVLYSVYCTVLYKLQLHCNCTGHPMAQHPHTPETGLM